MSAARKPERAWADRWSAALWTVAAACVARLWLMPLPSSFWVDEMGTAFVVRHPGDASFAAAPQVPASIYFILPKLSSELFGFSEVAYRLPSVILMALALYLVARLAARLIAPEAGWFAVFACFSLRGINYAAADARPYALGMAVSAAALLGLVRWFDESKRSGAALFLVCAVLLWRVQLIFWPFYLIFALYAGVRLWRRDTPVGWRETAAVFLFTGVCLTPVALEALALLRQAGAHVIVDVPGIRDLWHALKAPLFLVSVAGVWLAARVAGQGGPSERPAYGAAVIGLAWWLTVPLVLFAFSRITGTSLFLARYISLALPGAAMAATTAAAYFMPRRLWRPLACAFGVGVLIYLGQWRHLWPAHHPSDWRGASAALGRLGVDAATPVICPSPFVEAQPPEWRPGYPQSTFLYCHLLTYPPPGRKYTFPFKTSPEAERYAAELTASTLAPAGRFAIYGGDANVRFWEKWFARRPELAGWTHGSLDSFGDVEVALFQAPLRLDAARAGVAVSSARNTSAIQSAPAMKR